MKPLIIMGLVQIFVIVAYIVISFEHEKFYRRIEETGNVDPKTAKSLRSVYLVQSILGIITVLVLTILIFIVAFHFQYEKHAKTALKYFLKK